MNGLVRLVPSVPEAFADLVVDELSTASAGYALFLSGGGTAVECYRTLATRPGVAWSGVDVYLGDERCVPPDDPDSNHRMIVESLLDVVGPVRSDHPMYTSGPPAEAAAHYQELVAGIVPDLVHLGLGPDGHTASLFPGSVRARRYRSDPSGGGQYRPRRGERPRTDHPDLRRHRTGPSYGRHRGRRLQA